jgi:hypothetical protein
MFQSIGVVFHRGRALALDLDVLAITEDHCRAGEKSLTVKPAGNLVRDRRSGDNIGCISRIAILLREIHRTDKDEHFEHLTLFLSLFCEIAW